MFRLTGPRGLENLRRLTAREIQLVLLASDGLTDKDTAEMLGISAGTVITTWSNIRGKLGISSRAAAVAALNWAIAITSGTHLPRVHSRDCESMAIVLSDRLIVLGCNARASKELGTVPGVLFEGADLPWSETLSEAGVRVSPEDLPWKAAIRNRENSESVLHLAGQAGVGRFAVHCQVVEDQILKTVLFLEINPLEGPKKSSDTASAQTSDQAVCQVE